MGVALKRKQAAEDNGDVQRLPDLTRSIKSHRSLPGLPANPRVHNLGDRVHHKEAHGDHHGHHHTHVIPERRGACDEALHPQRLDIERNKRQGTHDFLPSALPLDVHVAHHAQGLHARHHRPEAHRGPEHGRGVGRDRGIRHVVGRNHQEHGREHGEDRWPDVRPAWAHCALSALEIVPMSTHAAGDASTPDCALAHLPDLHDGPISKSEIQQLTVAMLRGHALPDIKPIRRGAVTDVIPEPGVGHHLSELAENLTGALAAPGHLPIGAVRVSLQADVAGGALAFAH
mmetsp:Transcript_70424/g.161593  ORF Transcript_70424/g.161593 Transcript_70424/m.161593 type:complete len:287 (+) Transcript_70424:404-1264(+)